MCDHMILNSYLGNYPLGRPTFEPWPVGNCLETIWLTSQVGERKRRRRREREEKEKRRRRKRRRRKRRRFFCRSKLHI